MAKPTIQLGGGKWAGKTDNLLGYYKEGERFYKQDFTFSRSTTGTYTDKDGYIQEMPYNKLTYSEDFSNASWVKSNVTIENSIYTSPLGYSQKIVGSNNTSLKLLYKNNIITPTTTISALVKAEGYNYAIIFTGGGARVVFDLVNGTIGNSIGTYYDASINSQGDGWYIISMSNPNHTSYASVTAAISNSVYDRTGNGIDGIALAYIQVNEGTSAKTYFPTTTRLNMPRVDYLNNSNGSLILEPQSTNTVTYSEDFSQWTLGGLITPTLTSGQLSPSGEYNATKISGTIGSSILYITGTTSETATRSIYAKSVSGTGTATLMSYFGNTNNLFTLTEEWQRFELTGSLPDGGTNFYIDFRDSSQTLNEFIIWGAQSEELSYATSYIPTSGSSVTRNADACSITNAADRIGQTEGVIFVDFELQTTDKDFVIMNLYNTSSASNGIYFYLDGSNLLKAYCDNGGNQVLISSGVLSEGRFKAAFAYKENDFAFYLNGSLIGVDNSGTVPTCGGLRLENYQNSPTYQEKTKVYQAQIYNTRLSNSELATLTTL